MATFISKTELETKKSDNKNTHYTGEIYPQIFSADINIDFSKDMDLCAGIIWLGSYSIKSSLFPKEVCPKCGNKHSLTPYKAIGSILSGAHTIQFYCPACKEKFVTNDFIDYFRLIYKYIEKHRSEFSKEQILNNCTSAPLDTEIIH